MDFNFDWNYISAGAPYITISELGLALNMPAISLLNNPEDIVLGFDETKMAIGIMNAQEMPTAKAYKCNSRINNGWLRIGCKDFVKNLSVISGRSFYPAKKYVARLDETKKVLFITLESGKEEDAEDTETL